MNILLQWIAGIVARVVRTLDFWLMLPLLALMVIGLAVLHSAGGQDMHLVYAQGARFAVGLAALWLLSRLAPMRLRGIAPVLFGLSLVPLSSTAGLPAVAAGSGSGIFPSSQASNTLRAIGAAALPP